MGKLTQIIGCMFSGKSTELILEYVNAVKLNDRALIKKKICMIKHADDNRYSGECVSTHNGVLKVKADFVVRSLGEIPDLETYSYIYIDEAHFYPDFVDVVKRLVLNADVKIWSTTLNGTASSKTVDSIPFDTVTKLLPYSKEIRIIPAVCYSCRQDAFHTCTTPFGKEQNAIGIYVGGSLLYYPACSACLPE